MKRLGYTKFAAQGGDWGTVVVDMIGLQAPPELLGIHTNMRGIFPAEIDQAAFSGAPAPVAVSVFPDELYPAPRSWVEQAYPKLIHYNKVDEGGHFAAWEQQQLFSEEVRAGLRSLRH